MKNLNNRVTWLDAGKGVCMIFVMMAHIENTPWQYRQIYEPIYLIFFFFASGYVFGLKNNFKEFIINKIRGLLIPLIALSIIDILSSQLINVRQHSLYDDFIGLFLQIRGRNDTMWFVASLFVAEIAFYFVVKLCKNTKTFIFTIIIMGLASVCYGKTGLHSLPWHIQIIGIAGLFLGVGYLYKKHENKINIYILKPILLCGGFLYLILIIGKIVIFNDYKSIQINSYNENILIWFIVSFVGLLFFIELLQYIPNNKIVQCIGRNTLIFFAFHGKFQRLFEKIAIKTKIYTLPLNYFWLPFAYIIFEIICLLVVSYIIKRYLYVLLGRTKPSSL